jgi:hypothetical protein
MTEASNLSLVTIGIATTNRWGDLKNTLPRSVEEPAFVLTLAVFEQRRDQ